MGWLTQVGLVRRRTTIEEYVNQYINGTSGDGGLLFDAAPPGLVPRVAGVLGDLDDSVLSIGPVGGGLPFHNHAAAWQGTIRGSKLFAFLPPLSRTKESWLPTGAAGERVLERLVLPSPPTLFGEQLGWLARTAPTVLDQMEHCVLRPGDVVYIPCNWYHATINLEPTIAVGAQAGHDAAIGAKCADDRFGASFNLFRQARAMSDDRGGATLRAACELNRYQHECTTALAMVEMRANEPQKAAKLLVHHAKEHARWVRDGLLEPRVASAILARFANVLLRGTGGSAPAAHRGAAKIVALAAEMDGPVGTNLALQVLATTLALSTTPTPDVLARAKAFCKKLRGLGTEAPQQSWYTAGPIQPFDSVAAEKQLSGIVGMAERVLAKANKRGLADL